MHSIVEAVQDFVAFAESKRNKGQMKKNRLILPFMTRITSSLSRTLSSENYDGQTIPIIATDSSYVKRNDPEHRPATTIWQKLGNMVRTIPQALGSEASTLGFRATCATMTIGIIAYLDRTQHFFQQQRLVWGMIMTAISMAESKCEICRPRLGRLAVDPRPLIARLADNAQLLASQSWVSSCAAREPLLAWFSATLPGMLSIKKQQASSFFCGSSSSSASISCSNTRAFSTRAPSASSPCCLSSDMSCKSAKSVRLQRPGQGSLSIRMLASNPL
jgi:hypothetical protein